MSTIDQRIKVEMISYLFAIVAPRIHGNFKDPINLV